MNPEKPKNKLAAVVGLGAVAITLYWTFTYTGPYRYLAERELKWFGYYVPELTAIVIILCFLLIAGLIKLVLRGAERPVPRPATTTDTLPINPMKSAPVRQPWLLYLRFTAPVIMLGFAVWMYHNGTQAGSLQQLNALDFQNGNLPSRIVYADVRGRLSGTYLGKDHYLYIPMSPMSAETNGSGPISLLVGVNENQTSKYLHREQDGSFTVRGVADKGLEGDVKYAFEKNGMVVADTVWVVHTGRTPSEDRTFGGILGAISIAIAGLIIGLEKYRQKRAAPRPNASSGMTARPPALLR